MFRSKLCTLGILLLFVFPLCIKAQIFDFTPTPQAGFFQGQALLNGVATEMIDSIAAFDSDGNCAGATGIIINEGLAYINLAIYGDDISTIEDEGMDGGEYFTLKLYDASSNTIIDYTEADTIVRFYNWVNSNGSTIAGYDDPNQIYNFICATCNNGPFQLELSLLLEGTYAPTQNAMKKDLLDLELLPLNNPYTTAPWNDTNTENLNGFADFPNNTVDWILVEMRSGTPAMVGNIPGTSLVESQVGFLLTDGTVVNAQGGELVFFQLTAGEEYYILIHHRNHLDVISANPVQANSQMTYDFTSNTNQAFGIGQLKLASNGKAILYAGDYIPDGVIQNSDLTEWKTNPAQANIYSILDGNLDGSVQNTDKNTWAVNKAKVGTIEVQY